MNKTKIVMYITGIIISIGIVLVLQFYFSNNYDEYGLLDKQYLGNIADCQNCLIIETKDSQYSYLFGIYTIVDTTPKMYYFKNEHKLNDNLLIEDKFKESNPVIIKIHWKKVNDGCCIEGIERIGYLH